MKYKFIISLQPRTKKPKAATDGPKEPLKKKACGLCGKNRKLTKTECCDNWICDDEHKYRLFSYALNSCRRNHRRYSICAFHHTEGHNGPWKDCSQCEAENLMDDFPIDESYYERKPRVPKVSDSPLFISPRLKDIHKRKYEN